MIRNIPPPTSNCPSQQHSHSRRIIYQIAFEQNVRDQTKTNNCLIKAIHFQMNKKNIVVDLPRISEVPFCAL